MKKDLGIDSTPSPQWQLSGALELVQQDGRRTPGSIRARCTSWLRDGWGLESISLTLSTIFIVIIVIILKRVDGRMLTSWKVGVSIDSILSVLAAFSKSCLLMPTAEALGQINRLGSSSTKRKRESQYEKPERARHGTLGAVTLLVTTRGVTLASIGAAIILLSIPLDLFYQQIISYPTVAIEMRHVNATISRAVLYDPDMDGQFRGQEPTISEDDQLLNFFEPYWRGSGVKPGVQFDCPTSNCTYDPFHTLAIDYQFVDLAVEMLEFDCKNTSAEWLSSVSYEGPRSSPNITSCGWYLMPPNADMPQLMSGYEVTANGSAGEVLASRFYPLSDVFSNQLYASNGSIVFPWIKHPIVDFVLVSTPDGFAGALRNSTPVAMECEVHWVVRKIQGEVVNNVLEERTLETLQFEDDLDNALTWDPEDSDVYQANFTMTIPDPYSVSDGISTYGMDNITARKVWQTWAQLVPSTFTLPVQNASLDMGPVLKVVWLAPGPPHLHQVRDAALPWNTPANASDQMSQTITVMNQVMRRNVVSASKRHDVAVGTAWRSVVVVQVTWQWITFPAALWCCAAVFLAATMLSSVHRRQRQLEQALADKEAGAKGAERDELLVMQPCVVSNQMQTSTLRSSCAF